MAADITTFPLTQPITLMVRLGHGSVSVAARDGLDEATVRLSPRHGGEELLRRVTVELRGSTLVVSAPRSGGLVDLVTVGRRARDAVDAVLEVPAGTALKVATADADVSVTGECGNADIATGSGSVTVDRVRGDLRVRCGNAECRVGDVAGAVQVRAGRGAAHLARVGGRLEWGSGSGDLTVDVVGGQLRGRAGSGSAHVGAAHGDVDLALGSGPITVGLPAGVAARVDLTSGSGQTRSDLPVETAARGDGTPAITVRARTGSGEVHLLRTAPAG